MSLVSLQTAIDHLRIPLVVGSGGDVERDLIAKLTAAEAIIVDYLKRPDHGWTEATLPANVQSAILLQLTELWRYRGDDPDGADAATTPGDLSPTITNLLRRMRDPAVA